MGYVIDATQHFPKRWKCADSGSIRVMCGPVEGYLMVRRTGAAPFVITVQEILNTKIVRFLAKNMNLAFGRGAI